MMIYVDLDETLCDTPGDPSQPRDYSKASPRGATIEKINYLSDAGHEIVIWTARGRLTKTDWGEVTRRQLKKWGVKYDRLSFDKPVFDLLIDDKATFYERLMDWEDVNGIIL